MKKFNLKLYVPMIFGLTLLFGLLAIIFNGWFVVGVIAAMVAFIYVQNRSDEINHYCIGVDLDTGHAGDVLEISVYAFNKVKNQYAPVMTHFKQLGIFVNVIRLDNFYANIGYPIVEDMDYLIRQVAGSERIKIKDVKMLYRQMIRDVTKGYAFSAGAMCDQNLTQPVRTPIKNSLGGKLWNWWTFKTN
jgi:hypothetical protein